MWGIRDRGDEELRKYDNKKDSLLFIFLLMSDMVNCVFFLDG